MDNDFCTIMVIAEEGAKQLEFFLKNYRKCYPNAPLHVISDGIDNKDYYKLCKKYSADYTLGRYYKRIECGGLWWKRTLEIGLKYNKKWIIKVDPDTKFWRKFKTEPKHAVSGTHNNVGNPYEYIQGGCQAIRKDAAKKILNSTILTSNELTQHWNYCPDKKFLNSWLPTGYFTTDFSLMYIIRKLGIGFGDWKDIGCQWRVAPPNFDNKFAITHPHKIADHKKVGISDDIPLTIITTCKGRKHHLEQTLPKWLKEKNINVVVVDYNCPDNVGNWIDKKFPQVRVARVHNENTFNLSKARNVGAKYAPDGWWVFLDADAIIKPGFADEVRKVIANNCYFIASPMKWGMCGSVVLHSSSFKKAGGYDELFSGWGSEDLDFYARLRQANIRPGFWNGNFMSNIVHSDEERSKFYDKAKEASLAKNGQYYRLKSRMMIAKWRFLTKEERKSLLASIDGENNLENHYPGLKHSTNEPNKKKPIESIAINNPFGGFSGGFQNDSNYSINKKHNTLGQKPMNISVVNHSRIDLGISLEELCKLGANYLNVVGQFWPGVAANLIPTKQILPNTHAIVIMDDPDHNQEVLGYKDLTPDKLPLAKVFAKAEMVKGVPISVIFTHELGEFRVDPNNSKHSVDSDGTIYAVEIADPVDDDYFTLFGKEVANFVLPSWFESFHKPGSTKFDYMGVLSAPFSLANGGYATIRSSAGQWIEIFGSHPKLEDLNKSDQREWRSNVRKAQHHASTRLTHNNYIVGRS